MAAALISEDDLKLAIGPGADEQLRQLAGDDNTGAPIAARVTYGIDVASEEAYGLLLSGFETNERIQALAENDPLVRHSIAMIARETLAMGREQFRLPDGKCCFSPDARVARDALREKSRGAKRTSAETTAAGRSALLRPRGSDGGVRSYLTDSCGRPRGF